MLEKNGEILLEPDELYIPKGLPGGFFIYQADERMTLFFADENVIRLFGCSSMEELRDYTGNSFRGMVLPEDYEKIQNEIDAQTVNSEKRHDYVRYRIRPKDGDIRYIEDFGHLVYDVQGRSFYYVYIVDVDRNEYLNRSRNSFAEMQIFSSNQNRDRLTGLLNMNSFYQEVLEWEKSIPEQGSVPFTFIHFDIAGFKLFNEQFGFQRGDDLLCRTAATLRKSFPKSKIARFSNDHFVVCTDVANVCDRVNDVHNSILRIVEGTRVEIRAGIYEAKERTEAGIACDRARIACSIAKERYDVVYNIYDETDYEKLKMQQYITEHVEEAVEKGFIKVYYQPVIRVATGKICGYEALARWDDPKMGLLQPGVFIETLEKFHLIHKIDMNVIHQVCEDYLGLLERGDPLVPVSINLSRLDFELCDIVDYLLYNCHSYGVPHDMIDIEITESALNEQSDFLQKECLRLKNMGFSIWIDDFGSGYSSLNSLLDYSFDLLKVDLEFLRSYDRNKKTADLMQYIVYAMDNMGVASLTEGVESREHYDLVKAIGCMKAQGFYFGKPLPLPDLIKEMREKGFQWENPE